MSIRKIAALIVGVSLLAACGVNLIPSKDDWYAMHYYVMHDYEWQAYKALGPAARLEFQKIFWTVRSEYAKDEFDKRVEYCLKNYKRENSRQPFNVDRAHIYILNGPPAQYQLQQNDAWGTASGTPASASGGQFSTGISDRTGEDISASMSEIWTYPAGNRLVNYVFKFRSPSSYQLQQSTADEGQYRGALEQSNKDGFWAIKDPAAYKQKLEALKAMKEPEKK
jgi:GWxTD domain-containing protein